MAQLLTLTTAAVEQVLVLMQRAGKLGGYLRIAVAGGGCSGLSYKLVLEDEMQPTDKLVEFVLDEHNPIIGPRRVNVLVDMKSTLYLAGMQLDYSDDLMNAGWIFTNPNSKTTCGCGTSFGV
jgi:iron-sulfur cluster assembly protein